jgi:23S rRNA (guanosine2251-2'-O)-methyltransferase
MLHSRHQKGTSPPQDTLHLWGWHSVYAALHNRARKIHALMATSKHLGALKPLADKRGLKITETDMKSLDRRFDGAVHQGVAANVAPLPSRHLQEVFEASRACTLLALDQVQDPHNIGALMRSARALGAGGMILHAQGLPTLDGALAKAAAGALESLPIYVVANLSQALLSARDANFWSFGLSEAGKPMAMLPKVDRKILVLGAEGAGLRPLVAKRTDGLFALPTDPDFPTLNVSVAGALALALSKSMTA